MVDRERRRRSPGHRNYLYQEPPVWGIFAFIGLIGAAAVITLVFLFADHVSWFD